MSDENGDCRYSNEKNAPLIPLKVVASKFEILFSLYSPIPDDSINVDPDSKVRLPEHILKFWPSLFNESKLNPDQSMVLLYNIAKQSDFYDDKLFTRDVYFDPLIDRTTLEVIHDYELRWDEFGQEIKNINRFFLTQMIDTDLLGSVFQRLNKTHPKDAIFYRARISEEELGVNEMGKPPAINTGPGRANPIGIPYLYVSSDFDTTLYETRISLHETVTVGRFKTLAPLSVVSLKNIDEYGPFEIEEKRFTLEEFIRIKPYLKKLGEELSKPVRKQDTDLDYLPTQFLCEYIKSLGFDAVEYQSSMNPEGFNLAIFNDQKLTCESVAYHSVNEIKYKSERVN